jgi:hypothetical protein
LVVPLDLTLAAFLGVFAAGFADDFAGDAPPGTGPRAAAVAAFTDGSEAERPSALASRVTHYS